MGAVRVVLCATVAVVLGSVAVSGPAAAHTGLASSTPAAGDVLDRTPSELILTFTEDMDPALGAVVLQVAGKQLGRLELTGGGRATELVAEVEPGDLSDVGLARWRIDYRVTSGDGHPVTGSVSFRAPTSAPPADDSKDSKASSPSPSVDAESEGSVQERGQSEAEEEAAEDRESGSLINVLVVAGIVLLVLALGLVSLYARGRDEDTAPDESGEYEEPEPKP